MPFVWLDNTDAYSAKLKLAKARSKDCASWEWVKFSEEDYDAGQAFTAFMSEVMSYSLFNENGKVVYTYGVPKFQAKFAKCLEEIPSKVIVIILAAPARDTSLWKRAAAAKEKVKIDVIVDLTKDNAVEWITERARLLGAEIDKKSCEILIDIVGLSHNKLHSEIEKLKHLGDGKISPWTVQQGVCGTGEANVKVFCDSMLKGKPAHAHEMLDRIWKGDSARTSEKTVKFFGFPIDWARRTAIAASCVEFDEMSKAIISQITKGKDDSGNLVPMYPKPGAVYYPWKDFQESGRNKGWPLRVLMELCETQLTLRQLDEDKKEHLALTMLHQFVVRATETGGRA